MSNPITRSLAAVGRYLTRVLLSVDQLGNALLGGDEDETISSRLGKLKLKHGGRIPWTRPLSKTVDAVLDRIDPNHSIDAIELDEGVSVRLPDDASAAVVIQSNPPTQEDSTHDNA